MQIILINPPSPFLADDRAQPPTGLMYLAASLESNGFKVHIEDLAGRNDWEERTSELKADIFGVTCSTPNFPIVKRIAELLPKNSLKIVGGPHVTFLPSETLEMTVFDIAVQNEGEFILSETVKDYKDGKRLKRIYNGSLVDINKIPSPARHLVNLTDYHPEMEGAATTVFTSRGCPYSCGFCCKITGNIVRFRTAESVVEEIKLLINKYSFRNIIFEDDNFCLNRARVKKICEELRDFGINIRICPRADSVDKELLKILRKAGVSEISYGVESGSQKILNLMNKKLTVDTSREAIESAKEVGMIVKIYLIVGFPGETEETVEETKWFVEETKPDKWLLQNFIPYPGTDVWNRPEKYGVTWISKDYGSFYTVGRGGKGGIVFRTEEMDEERIRILHDNLYAFLMNYKPMHRG